MVQIFSVVALLALTGASPGAAQVAAAVSAQTARVGPANELGRIPILEYHLVGDRESRWGRERGNFRRDLELLYARGYRPVTVADLIDKKLDLPAGTSPVVFTFDDASPSQFSYVKRADGTLVPDPSSAIGIWLEFARTHAGWGTRATFCVLSNADAGHAFFGNKGLKGQETAWRFPKLRFLVQQGFELCNHTLYHVKLSRVDDATVREQIGRAQLAIDSAGTGARVRTFALPLGLWPKNRALAFAGTWTEPKTNRVVRWTHDAVLEVADTKSAGPISFSPYDSRFDPRSLPRFQVTGNRLAELLDRLDRTGQRYVSDGNPAKVTAPSVPPRPTAPPRGGRAGS